MLKCFDSRNRTLRWAGNWSDSTKFWIKKSLWWTRKVERLNKISGADKRNFTVFSMKTYFYCLDIKIIIIFFFCYLHCLDQLSHTAPASERVKFILGGDGGEEEKQVLETPQLFTELEELFVYLDGNAEWKETARWYVFIIFYVPFLFGNRFFSLSDTLYL